ncbi:MAG: hypothetical protein KDD34_00900 [Bdellovibrionales bacterium]|nr:hypothetical protein [Bdellovibrionales bacterium]
MKKPYNGGSDQLLFYVSFGLFIGRYLEDHQFSLSPIFLFLSFLICLTYFYAGWVKFRSSSWQNGRAFWQSSYLSCYGPLSPKTSSSKIITQLILVFELLFPLSLFHPFLAIIFIIGGMSFHLGNIYLLGLNRFFWTWVICYPSLLWIAKNYHIF